MTGTRLLKALAARDVRPHHASVERVSTDVVRMELQQLPVSSFPFCLNASIIFKLHRMHEMQTIVTDVRGVYLSVCPSVSLSVTRLTVRGSFSAAFAKSLWPLVSAVVV